VRGTFDLEDGLAGADSVVAVLKVEAESDMSNVLKEDITDGAVNDVVDGRSCISVRAVSVADGGEHG